MRQNGGHCQPFVYGSPPAVAAFELANFAFLDDFVRAHAVPCDWTALDGGVHAYLSRDLFEVAAAAAEQVRRAYPDIAAGGIEVIYPEQRRVLAALRVPGAVGAVVQHKAATVWPYKLVAWLLERLLAGFPAPAFNLQTNTPITKLRRLPRGDGDKKGGSSPYRWELTTPRGQIVAKQVLLATNAYTSRLLPAFADLIVPVRGQLGALLPPRPASGSGLGSESGSGSRSEPGEPVKLTRSYLFASHADDASGLARDDYMGQRPLPGGELVYGGGRRRARGLAVGEWRDDEVEEAVAKYLRSNLSPPLDLSQSDGGGDGDEQEKGRELEASFEWTGIMGYSRDHNAWVGAVPESMGGGDGLWICAGYTGHGMPVATLSARAVVRRMTGATDKEEDGPGARLPDEFVLSEERVRITRETLDTVEEREPKGWLSMFPQLLTLRRNAAETLSQLKDG